MINTLQERIESPQKISSLRKVKDRIKYMLAKVFLPSSDDSNDMKLAYQNKKERTTSLKENNNSRYFDYEGMIAQIKEIAAFQDQYGSFDGSSVVEMNFNHKLPYQKGMFLLELQKYLREYIKTNQELPKYLVGRDWDLEMLLSDSQIPVLKPENQTIITKKREDNSLKIIPIQDFLKADLTHLGYLK